MGTQALRWADLAVIAVSFALLLGIGVICSRRSKSAEGYFLAGRSMPGWVLAFSMMATIVSSMTFLALPALTFEFNWWHFPANSSYVIAMFVALILFVPFYRRATVNSAYEYLERRFGTWARLYAAACFVIFHVFRMGIILYVVSLALQRMVGGDLTIIFCLLGVLVAVYTIIGGLQAVIWTDLFQGIALIGGGLICLPIIVSQLPDGFMQIIHHAGADNKFSIDKPIQNPVAPTMLALLVTKLVVFFQMLGTDQTSVQRYCAAKTDKDARRAVLLGGMITLPVWTYFFFIGTALYVFYQALPDPEAAGLKPDQIFAHFILTQVPAGWAGFAITGLLAAALSTLDSSINAAAATVTNDFYRRLWVRNRSSQHYAFVGRLLSVAFGVIMIGAALTVHLSREGQAAEDIQTLLLSIASGGLLGLFLLGFLTRRVDSRAACVATVATFTTVTAWLVLDTFGIIDWLPDKFWVGPFSNVLLFGVGYATSWVFGRKTERDLIGLTVWTIKA